jgi:phospholipase/lecithinase/hemolysin
MKGLAAAFFATALAASVRPCAAHEGLFGTPQPSLGTEIALTFDQAELAGLGALQAPGLKVFDLQTFVLFDEIVVDLMAFGFNPTTIHDACLDAATRALCSALPAVQNTHLFWNDVHPTDRGHSITASFARALVAPEPPTRAMMVVGFMGLVLTGFRARSAGAHLRALACGGRVLRIKV